MSLRSNLGVTVHQRTDLLDHVAALGLSIARLDANWYDVQRTGPDDWQWDWLDALIDGCVARGLTPYPVVGYGVTWAGARNQPPNIEDWSRFIGAFGERYAGKVKYIGLWNEANIPGMFAGSVEQYVLQVLKPAAETLRPMHPDFRICAPELSSEGRWWDWLEACLRLGRPYIDVITIHVYKKDGYSVIRAIMQDRPSWIPRWVPWIQPSVCQVLKWAGVTNAPLALTEYGFNTAKLSEEQQATYYDQFLSQVDSAHLLAAVSFNLINESRDVQWGLLRDNRSEKPVASVIRRYTGPVVA